jgi:hypothetical protein
MRKFLMAGLVALTMIPTAAVAQHRGWHGGGFHHGGGHWHNGQWIPFAVGAGILGGAIIASESCYRWVVDQWGYRHRVWVCN